MVGSLSLEFLAIGFVVGLAIGLTGIGGGALMTPMLIFLGFSPIHAVGSDLVFNSVTKGVGSIIHLKKNSIESRILKALISGSIPSIIVTSLLIIILKGFYGSNFLNFLIGTSLGLLLLLVGIMYMIKHNIKAKKDYENIKSPSIKLTVLVGFLITSAVHLTSVGSGTLLSAYLIRSSSSTIKIVGTTIAFSFILTAISSLVHILLGNVRFYLVATLLLGSIPGIVVSSKLISKINERFMKNILILLILISGIVLLYKVFLSYLFYSDFILSKIKIY